jgi:hypothetical protein
MADFPPPSYAHDLRKSTSASTALFTLALVANIMAAAAPFWARSTNAKYVDFHVGLWRVCAEAGDSTSACQKSEYIRMPEPKILKKIHRLPACSYAGQCLFER